MDLLSVFLFSGIVFGWAPLNSLLLSERTFYKDLCPDGAEEACDAQRSALNQAFTIASTAVSLVALPAGYFVDKKGPIWGVTVAGVLEVLGLVGIALCEKYGSLHFDLFLYSFTLIAVGGAMTMFCGYTLPFVFPAYATLLVETTSCLFDGSCIIFTGFSVVYNLGISFSALWWGYAALAVVIYGLLIFAWLLCREELDAARAGPAEAGGEVEGPAEPRPSSDEISAMPLTKQMRTLEFVAIFLYATIQVTRSNLYLGTVDLYNETLEDKVHMSPATMTTLAGLIIPFGFIAVPAIEACVHHLGTINTVHVTTLIGLSYAVVQLWWINDVAQLVGSGLFAVWRAFLFSIISAFVMQTFGPQTMGRIMGLCFLSAAIVNLAQAPLVKWTLNTMKGDFSPLLLGAACVSLPLPIPWFVVVWKQRRQGQARAPLLQESGVQATLPPASSFEPTDPPMSWHGTALGSTQPLTVLKEIRRRGSIAGDGACSPQAGARA
eukprot:CAMPEP_0178442418 /NCGR_PEP_ID=MMETSP0689_2-20121128/38140_1 /TAXON_ID=160604 /ORGANISM="Amphidinium massartii, Strain CS-259" /LENGTH=492 /DNA_ID=CAMNT_0020065935 /DNA_START=98 /DNA_END=1576 /DNA_ORIENTATION=+